MTVSRPELGSIGVWGQLATLPATRLRPFVTRLAELGYGSLWVGDGTARDPFAQLAAVAEAAAGMTLGTSVVNIFGRDAMAARMAAMTLHELTGGRFVLGLGVSHVHLVETLRGHAYERPLERMREYLASYAQLPYRGPLLTGSDGQPTEPPVLIAALRTRMLGLAATATDGTLPYLVSVARVARMRQLLDEARPTHRPSAILAPAVPVIVEADAAVAREAGRAWIASYCRSVNYQRSLVAQGYTADDWEPPASDRLIDDIVAWGPAERVRTASPSSMPPAPTTSPSSRWGATGRPSTCRPWRPSHPGADADRVGRDAARQADPLLYSRACH
jgi:probable F420-dependent oxidoreductase